jgi:hypothetical protein
VHLKGLVRPQGCWFTEECIESNPSGLPQVYVLPSGYRPAEQELQGTLIYNGKFDETLSARVDIAPNGRVIPIAMIGIQDDGSDNSGSGVQNGIGWLSLDGITFRAAN